MSLSKKIFAGLLFLVVLGVAIGVNTIRRGKITPPPVEIVTTPKEIPPQVLTTIIGASVEGRNIEVHSYGSGATHLLFVGGIHGGYEWNSTLLAYNVIDYLTTYPALIPKNLTIDIIPSVNPDALYKVTGKVGRFSLVDVTTETAVLRDARFNAHKVDLNRNFDCDWKPKSTWQSKTVSAGTAPFSEPEARVLKDFILTTKPSSVIFWHSKSNGVYASQCRKGILHATKDLMNTYAQASGYPAIETFDAYAITGAAEDWLASINIPAITVELKTHETIELEQNLRGVRAVMEYHKK